MPFRRLAAGTGTLAALTLFCLPAAAQYYYPAPRSYPPAPPPYAAPPSHQADAIVRSLGLMPLGPAQRQGPMLVVRAVGQEGTQVQVTLDRRTGRVLEIIRIGHGSPRMVALPAPLPRGPYEADDDEDDEYADDDNDEVYPPLVRGRAAARNYPEPSRGPAVITREGIQSHDLAPPDRERRSIERDPDFTGSVPGGPYVRERGESQRPGRGSVDPLLGVPKEFRSQQPAAAAPAKQRTAARAPEAAPRAAPLPRPRPADAPQVAQSESTSPRAAKPAAAEPSLSPAAREDAAKFPPVQPLE